MPTSDRYPNPTAGPTAGPTAEPTADPSADPSAGTSADADPFAATRARFALPEGVLYLDGNSLGPPPAGVAERVAGRVREEWGERLIRGWNDSGWMVEPERVGSRIGRLIGAWEDSVVVGDTLSIRLFQALDAALARHPGRPLVLSDTGNFPSDLYMAEGLLRRLGGERRLELVAPEAVAARLDDSVAVLMLTHVDYRSGRLHDMAALTEAAHALDIPVVWDLAHSSGAVEVDLAGVDADFAVGCTYKYLNGGPGAPAFIAVNPRRQEAIEPLLAGWLGHAEPFAFEPRYRPAPGVARLRVGTPPVLAMAALDAALDVWDGIDMGAVRARSIALSERFVAEVEARCPALSLASPRDPRARGSQVSFAFEHGYAAMRALIERHGVIGDFRAPDLMRFAFTPLYLSMDDVLAAVDAIETVVRERQWDDPAYRARAAVT